MTGDVQRRVAEVLAGHPGIEWMGAASMEHRCTGCHAVVLGEAAPDFTAFGGRTVGQCALAAHQAAVLAAEGLLAGDGPVAGGTGPLSAHTGAAGHPDQDEATEAAE